jgi:pimeloyl-ACP methyl ester carboxylesterase
MEDLVPALLEPTVLDAAPQLALPMLVVWGDADRLVSPRVARELATQHRRIELRMLPECGHMPMLEMPDEVASRMSSFLSAHAPMPRREPQPVRADASALGVS